MSESLFNKFAGLRPVKNRTSPVVASVKSIYKGRSNGIRVRNCGGSRTAATSKKELSVIIVNDFQQLTIITKSSILDVAAVLDLLLTQADLSSLHTKKTQQSSF